MIWLRVRCVFAFIVFSMAIPGCGGSESGGNTGRISVGVSDAPMHDAVKICIAFDQIELKPKDGPPILVEELLAAKQTINVNLLEFPGMNAAPLLMDYEVPAGEYLWLRLGVNAAEGGTGGVNDNALAMECQGDESYLALKNGGIHNLYIPSGAESGLKLTGSIIIPQGGEADFTAEIDLAKSVAYPGGLAPDAIFRPTMRLVNNAEVGAITGKVDTSLIVDGCKPTAYIFEGDTLAVEPTVDNALASALVQEQTNNLAETEYHYTVGFLLPGSYGAAFSCDDGATLRLSGDNPVGVVVNEVATANFP